MSHRLLETFFALALAALLGGALASCTNGQTVDDEEPTDQQAERQPENIEFEEVIDRPDNYQNRWVRGEVTIDSLISDKAFFIRGDEGNRMFAAFHLKGESRADLKPGQQVQLEGQIVDNEEALERLRQLDEPAPEQLEEASFALLISEADDVEILSEPPAAEAEQKQQETDQPPVTIGQKTYGNFDDWDADADEKVTREEFRQGVADQQVYADLDADGDGQLTQDEFRKWVFGAWDADNDGNLTEEEFEAGTEQFDDYEWGDFEDWNTDDDQMLTTMEFVNGEAETDLFDAWDADDSDFVDEEEFSDGLFDVWDDDENEGLQLEEMGFELPED